jgi:uncharacterized protein
LDQGAVQLATIQADQASGRKARLVAELYPDTFQIVVRRDSGIDSIDDLVGKRIALPPSEAANMSRSGSSPSTTRSAPTI